MSAPEERGALTSRPSLYSYALRLHRAEPDGRLPAKGYPLPDAPGTRRRSGRSWAEFRDRLTELLRPLLVAPDAAGAAATFELRLSELASPVRPHHIRLVVKGLVLEHEDRALALARCLTRTGTSAEAVCVGLALLARLGEPEDVPYLRTLGQLRDLAGPAVFALDAVDRPTAALVWLGHHAEAPELRGLVDALVTGDEESVRRCLVTVPREPGIVTPETARRVAEASRPAELLLRAPVVGPGDAELTALTALTGWLLFRMTSLRGDWAEILSYPDAVRAYEAVVAHAGELTPTLDHYGILLSMALDLHSGPSRLHEWGPGRREELLEGLEAVLSRPENVAVLDTDADADADADTDGDADADGDGDGVGVVGRRRIGWARRSTRQLFSLPAQPVTRLRFEAVVRDPVEPAMVELRVLIDGRPLVPEFFGWGPANDPEYLLDSGRLRATGEPTEVQLAEAYCTEGCCGALYVTIRRDGDQVVWSDWRRPAPPPSLLHARELPEYRFDAAVYDAEVRRAENDRSWTWPARRVSRLIAAGLRDRPELLTRWDVRLGWVGTDVRDPDRTAMSLLYAGEEGSLKQYMWHIPEDGTAPEERAAAVLHRLATVDPRTYGS
ncbi:hypothetical protein [Streptomyces sp. RKAG290]|uniref:hypothetical protein n=1 Tax=Streptomyces sp. RKAG290 TaxID=2888348 RepID=UPI0020333B81|nr:hypothetical protein [Streptomyces sp. RKAG290]MCM2412725.1 hypothetical protein [Streptomyces sp. RKAG290]